MRHDAQSPLSSTRDSTDFSFSKLLPMFPVNSVTYLPGCSGALGHARFSHPKYARARAAR